MKRSIDEIKAMATRGVGFDPQKSTTVELTPEDVAAIDIAAEKSSATPVPIESTKPDLDMDAVRNMITEAISSTNEAHKREIEALQQSHQDELNAIKSESEVAISKASSEVETLQTIISTLGLDRFKGEPQPVTSTTNLSGQMTVLGTGSDESRRFAQMLRSLPGRVVSAERGGQVLQRDTRSSDEFLIKNKDRIRDGLEAEMREAGLLQGTAVTSAITGVADIPSLSFEYLSAVMRQTHFPDLIHWQFANYSLELGTRPGLVIAVPRFDDIARPASFSARVLTPGTTLNAAVNPVLERNVLITLQELGLGKDVTNAVLGLSTFVNAYSLQNLEDVIIDKLGRDWAVTKDMGLYERWFTTDRVVYSDNGVVTTAPTDLVTGDNGTLTQRFLINLRAYLKVLRVPTYRDNYYGLVLNPYALAQFMQDKSGKERDAAMRGEGLVTAMLQSSTGQQFGGEVSGYRGAYEGFHIFEQNVYGVGAAGEPGSQNVTLGVGPGSRLMDSSFAFGPNTIAWAEGLPVEIRMSSDDDFQRQKLMTWYAHCAPGVLNVKNDVATGEQLRVVEIRTPRVPV